MTVIRGCYTKASNYDRQRHHRARIPTHLNAKHSNATHWLTRHVQAGLQRRIQRDPKHPSATHISRAHALPVHRRRACRSRGATDPAVPAQVPSGPADAACEDCATAAPGSPTTAQSLGGTAWARGSAGEIQVLDAWVIARQTHKSTSAGKSNCENCRVSIQSTGETTGASNGEVLRTVAECCGLRAKPYGRERPRNSGLCVRCDRNRLFVDSDL